MQNREKDKKALLLYGEMTGMLVELFKYLPNDKEVEVAYLKLVDANKNFCGAMKNSKFEHNE